MSERPISDWIRSLKEKLLSVLVRSSSSAEGKGRGAPEVETREPKAP